jgi:hypothetical protein
VGRAARVGRSYFEDVSRFEPALFAGFESVDVFASFDSFESFVFSLFELLLSESPLEPLPLAAPSLAGSLSRDPPLRPPARLSVR